MNRRSILKVLFAAPLVGVLAPIAKLFGESSGQAPLFSVTKEHAQPQRIDTLSLKHWGKVTVAPIEFYDVAGQTVFPRLDKDGKYMGSVCMVMFPVQVPKETAAKLKAEHEALKSKWIR